MGEALAASPAGWSREEWSRELSYAEGRRDHRFKWVLRRLLMAVFVVWGSVTLLFAIFFVVPGDRVDKVMGGDRVVSAETHAQVTRKFALDRPLVVQYGHYWRNLLRGDLGTSYVNDRDVSDILSKTTSASMRLAFWAVLVEINVGAGSGIFVAVKRSRSVGALGVVSTTAMLSLPVFVIGFVLQLAFGVFPFQHGWPQWMVLHVQGIGPDSWAFGIIPLGEQWRYLVLPALTLGSVSGAVLHRLTRDTVRSAMDSDFARAARARGVRERDVIVRHGIRNAIVPILTFVGVDLATLFGAAVVTESVFNWPGVGSQMAIALARADAPVVLGLTIILAIAYSFVNLLVDVVHTVIDPRVTP